MNKPSQKYNEKIFMSTTNNIEMCLVRPLLLLHRIIIIYPRKSKFHYVFTQAAIPFLSVFSIYLGFNTESIFGCGRLASTHFSHSHSLWRMARVLFSLYRFYFVFAHTAKTFYPYIILFIFMYIFSFPYTWFWCAH